MVLLDHAFITCDVGAPEADALLSRGFVEGSSNTHPGQGTANRRFFFSNFMLELFWVADGVAIGVANPDSLSAAARRVQDAGLLSFFRAESPVLEIRFRSSEPQSVDCRPALPVIFRGVGSR